MPWIVPALPYIAAGVGAAAAVKGGIDARKAAGQQSDYNAEIDRLSKAYRLDVMNYQNTTYANDIDFFNKQVAWQKEEFEKGKTRIEDTRTAVDQNMFGLLAGQMTKIVEENMAEALGLADVAAQVRQETGAVDVRVADSGVGGNVVAMLRGDVARQGGNAATITSMNAASARRQSMQEAQQIKAERDTQLSQLTIPVFQPMQAPAPPSPVSPVNPSAPSQRLGAATIALNAVSSGINLAVGANSLIK